MAQVDDVADERKLINPRQLEAVRQNCFASKNKHQDRIRKHENCNKNVKKNAEFCCENAITRVTFKNILVIFVFISPIMKVPDDLIDFFNFSVSNPEGL